MRLKYYEIRRKALLQFVLIKPRVYLSRSYQSTQSRPETRTFEHCYPIERLLTDDRDCPFQIQ